MDGCSGKTCQRGVSIASGKCFESAIVLLDTEELFSLPENKLYGYADDSTLVAVVPFPGERAAVTESQNRHLNRVSIIINIIVLLLFV